MLTLPVVMLMLFLLSGCSGKKTGYFWHVSDFHLDVNYTVRGDGVDEGRRDYFLGNYNYKRCWESGGDGRFGDYECDASAKLLESAIDWIRARTIEMGWNNIKFILWTGDDNSHAEDEYHDAESSLRTIKRISVALKGLEIPVFPVLGNHDAFPHSQMATDADNVLYQKTAEMWKDMGWPDEAYVDYKKHAGFYEMRVPGQPYRFVGLNTNFYYATNKLTANHTDPAGQFKWLRQVLTKARSRRENVFLFAHIPPGKFERFYQYYEEDGHYGYPWFRPRYNEEFLDILVEFSDVIKAQFYGHHHTDTFKLIRNKKTGKAVGVGFVAPAITPWRSSLAPETGSNNPGIRLYQYNTETGEVLNYLQFWLNLTKANEDGRAFFNGYTFKNYYYPEMESLRPDQYEKLAEKMLVDDGLFEKYYAANSLFKDNDYPCDKTCKTFHYCSVSHQHYDLYEQCLLDNGISNHPTNPYRL